MQVTLSAYFTRSNAAQVVLTFTCYKVTQPHAVYDPVAGSGWLHWSVVDPTVWTASIAPRITY